MSAPLLALLLASGAIAAALVLAIMIEVRAARAMIAVVSA